MAGALSPRGDGPDGFGIAVDDGDEGRAVVRLRGELDVACASGLAECLAHLVVGGKDVVVDLKELRFVDSTGIGALVRARNLANGRGADILLRGATPSVRKTLGLAGLDKVFTIEA